MKYEMKLQPKYYNFILNGTKRIEIRLFDEKRQQIKIGDTIKFLKEPNLNESFNAKVTGLLRYNTFEDMFRDFNISVLSDKSMTKEELINTLEQFYTKEKELNKGQQSIESYYNQLIELIKFNLIDSLPISELDRIESFLEIDLFNKVEISNFNPRPAVKSLKKID